MNRAIVKPRIKTLDLIYAALFAVLITICSWISVPAAVPFTMQTFAVFLTVGLLGAKRASIAIVVYLLLGFIGLPVFAGFKAGLGVLIGPTGGYLIGFVVMVWVIALAQRLLPKKKIFSLIAMLIGLLVLYVFGTAWYMFGYIGEISWASFVSLLGVCVVPFIIPDIAKIVLALLIIPKLLPHIKE